MFTAQRASEDIEYRTPVESKNSQNIGVVAIGFMTTVLSGIVALDVLWIFHKLNAAVKVKPIKSMHIKRGHRRVEHTAESRAERGLESPDIPNYSSYFISQNDDIRNLQLLTPYKT